MSIEIHGNEYVTVAERLKLATKDIQEIYTEVLQFDPKVVVRATVILKDGRKATGISAANDNKQIEKESPFEIAETSALGRCLGFLNYGLTDNIATAEEMKKVDSVKTAPTDLGKCPKCGADMKLSQQGKKYCSKLCWKNPIPDKVQEEFTAF